MSTQKFLDWWERGVYGALCCSIFLLGLGRIELGFLDQGMSAWSISRTTFGFWVILKLLTLIYRGWPENLSAAILELAPLWLFFTTVTISLLPDFRSSGDYRYLIFAVAHAVMVVDQFASIRRQRWLLLLLAVSPLILVVRGFIYDPSIFNFALAHRFGYPLDHANTAGYLLAMSFPLCLLVALAEQRWLRWLAVVSCLGQILALLLTYSRGSWLGWIGALVFFAVASKQWKPLIATVVIVATCVAALPSVSQRMFSVIRPHGDPSMEDRLRVLKDAICIGLDHPVLGVGYGRGRLKGALRSDFQETYSKSQPIHSHSVYVELFAETGVLGLGAFLWLILNTLYRLLRSARDRAPAERLVGLTIASSWTAAAVAGVGDIPFYHHEPRIFFFSLFALAYLYCRATDVPRAVVAD